MRFRSTRLQIVHLPTTDVANAIRTERPDAILTIGPLGSRITTDAIAALVAHHAEQEAADLPADRLIGGDRRALPGLREQRDRQRRVRRLAVTAGGRDRDRDGVALPRRRQHRERHDDRRTGKTPAVVAADAVVRTDRFCKNRKTGHRQGRQCRRASRRQSLFRRRAEDILRAIQRSTVLAVHDRSAVRFRTRPASPPT